MLSRAGCAVACLVFVCGGTSKPACQAALRSGVRGADVVVETIDGTVVEGEWQGIVNSNSVRVLVGESSRTFAFDELSTVIFNLGRPACWRSKPVLLSGVEFILVDGSRLPGEIVSGAADGVVCKLSVGAAQVRPRRDDMTLTFDQLVGIRWGDPSALPRVAALFEESLLDRATGHDLLVSRNDEKVRAIPGRIERLDAQGGSIRVGDQLRSFRIQKVYGVIFAKSAASPASGLVPLTVMLTNGSMVGANAVSTTDDAMTLTSSVGFSARLTYDRIERLTFRSDRIVFLSDVPTVSRQVTGILHRSWAVRTDRSVSGGPLELNGRRFAKGIGVHSRTELIYDLGGTYERFAATIGIDDFVRPAGSVVFRVFGDGRILYDSGELTGRDEPLHIRVDVVRIKILTLLVDYGKGIDLSDHADWAGARLIRPTARSQ